MKKTRYFCYFMVGFEINLAIKSTKVGIKEKAARGLHSNFSFFDSNLV